MCIICLYKESLKICKLSMNDISNIIIVGGSNENPAYLETQLDPVKLSTDCEVCVSSLCHGEVYNIHEGNNTVYFYHGNQLQIERIKQIRGKAVVLPGTDSNSKLTALHNPLSLRSIKIPEGNYESSISLFWVIASLIRDSLGLTRKRDAMNPTLDKMYNIISVELNGIFLIVEGATDTPWSLLNIFEDSYESFAVQNIDLRYTVFPAMLYANIVGNSYVNGKLSRNLGVVPINNKLGWSFYKPANPHYFPIIVREFSKIAIVLRDVNDNYVKLNPKYKTILTLNVRPIKGGNSETKQRFQNGNF